jgi:hypothetical protein
VTIKFDPRQRLYDKLLSLNIPKKEAFLIALDSGGQGVINREYLYNCQIENKALQDKILLEINKCIIEDNN